MSAPLTISAALEALVRQPPRNPEAVANWLAGNVWARLAARRATGEGLVGRVLSRFTPRQRPRSPDRKASRDRRRMLGGSSALPDTLRQYYTEGQRSVLCVVAGEVKRHGVCDLPIDQIGGLAGVCRTTVQTTMHEARRLRHVKITERPRPGRKSLPNVVEVISREWCTWLRRGPSAAQRIGSNPMKMVSTTNNKVFDDADADDACERQEKESGYPSKEAIEIAAELATIAGHTSSLPKSWQEAKPANVVQGWLDDIRRVGGEPQWLRTVARHVMLRKPDKRPPHSIRYFGPEIGKIVTRCAADLANIAAARQGGRASRLSAVGARDRGGPPREMGPNSEPL